MVAVHDSMSIHPPYYAGRTILVPLENYRGHGSSLQQLVSVQVTSSPPPPPPSPKRAGHGVRDCALAGAQESRAGGRAGCEAAV